MQDPDIIVGGGIAGLSRGRRLNGRDLDVQMLEAASRVGGRTKTDCKGGYLPDRGFQVLQYVLRTYRISHVLPDQSPPIQNPTCPEPRVRSGVFPCGEHGSRPGIQCALFSGRLAADAVLANLAAG
jgi:phytoene dehydrogenase-like protein